MLKWGFSKALENTVQLFLEGSHREKSRLTFFVPHGNVCVQQRGKGALFGELGLCCEGVVPQSLYQHGGQV